MDSLEHPDVGQGSDSPTIYLNGAYLPRDQAGLSVLDRGAMFGDGVYEVVRYMRGRAFEIDRHLRRLERSLAGIELNLGLSDLDLPAISRNLIRQNALTDAKVYWQITRGPAPRGHLIPARPRPTVLVMADPIEPVRVDQPLPVRQAALVEDTRWCRCWIKSLMLLPNVLAKSQARRHGAEEAVMVRDGLITEGGSTNVFMVRDSAIWTHPADPWILPGITREVILELAAELGIAIHERRFTPHDLLEADDAFLVGTTTNLARLTHLDGSPIGTDRRDFTSPSPITERLHEALIQRMLRAGEVGISNRR